MHGRRGWFVLGAVGALALLTSGCPDGGGGGPSFFFPMASGKTVFAVTSGNNLIAFDLSTPNQITSRAITGLQSGESLVGIDFRPATGELYALGSNSRLYVINLSTGGAVFIGATPTLSGTLFGVDFNPVPDRLRIVSDADQNLRLNPDTGASAVMGGGNDTSLSYASGDPNAGQNPSIVSVAYTNNFAGTSATTLYGIDSARDILVTIGGPDGSPSPNGGQLFTVGGLGVDVTDVSGFDIGEDGIAIAAFTSPGAAQSLLFSINLQTGAAQPLTPVGSAQTVRAIAIQTTPTVFGLTTGNNLISFKAGTPGSLIATRALAGLQSGETMLGIDFRPATGQLFGLGSSNRVYTINTATGDASPFATFTPALNGTDFGFDFNPVPDRIRVNSNLTENRRLNPNNGQQAAQDTALAYAATDINAGIAPNVVGAAYTNNFAGTNTTTLYVIDSNLDILCTQGGLNSSPSPDGGQLFTVGGLGFNTSDQVGFDITPSGAAFASLTALGGTTSTLFSVNLTTGAATQIGNVGGTETLRDIAVQFRGTTIFAVDGSNNLMTFNPATSIPAPATTAITGIDASDTLRGLDFRPANRRLYALGVNPTPDNARIYTIDATGFATQIGTGFTVLDGTTSYGFDFNPVPDRIRFVSTLEENFRVNPDTGAQVTPLDTNLAPAGDVEAVAYDRNVAGTTVTTLFGIDTTSDMLVRIGGVDGNPSPNAGAVTNVGPLGVDAITAQLDIGPNGAAFAALLVGANTNLYRINLSTGAATLIAQIGSGGALRGIAVQPGN